MLIKHSTRLNRILDDDDPADNLGIVLFDIIVLHILVGHAHGLGFDGNEWARRRKPLLARRNSLLLPAILLLRHRRRFCAEICLDIHRFRYARQSPQESGASFSLLEWDKIVVAVVAAAVIYVCLLLSIVNYGFI